MGVRIRKSKKLGAGVRLNLSKSGIGVSVGVKGARAGISSKGVRANASVPGTGIGYEKRFSSQAPSARPRRSDNRNEAQGIRQKPSKPKRRRWPYVVAGIVLLLAVYGNLEDGPSTGALAPQSATAIPTVLPTQTAEVTQVPTIAPTSARDLTNVPEQQELHVWVANSSTNIYHSVSTCSGMKSPSEITLSDAKGSGMERCGKCY